MSFRHPNGPEERALSDRYVVWSLEPPSGMRYLRLLNPLYKKDPDSRVFETALADDAREISDEDLGRLLAFEWRARLTAAWLIGLDQRTQFRAVLGEFLLASELVYAGAGYCFALARFGQPEDADILAAYLDRYLPRPDCQYNQDSAIGALLHLDRKFGTSHADRFIAPWENSAFAGRDPFACQRRTAELCDFADRIMSADA